MVRNHWSRLGNVRPGLTRKLVLYCGGVAAPLALTGILLWRAGVFDKFWFWTVSYARQYALEIPFSGGMELLRGTIPGVVGPNGAIWLTAAAGLILVSWKKVWWKKDDRETALFLAGLLFFSFLAVCPGFYFREHYFVLMLPAVALLAGGAVSAVSRMMPGAWWHHAVYCGVLVFSVMQQKEFLFRMTPAQVSRTMYGTNPFPEAVQIADYIRTHSTKNARIAVLGSEPEIPFYADRRSATGYIYTYGLMEPQPFAMKMQTEMIQELAASRPEFVVFVGIHTSWLRRPDSPPVLFDWWRIYGPQHYRLAGIIDIVAADRTVYRWEDVEAYKPQSENLIAVYKRTGS